MLQIRRIRYFTKTDGSKQEYDTNFDPEIFAENHSELFKNLTTYTEQIPPFERYNCHYTLGHNEGGKKRGKGYFLRQNIIPFDIDGIEFTEDTSTNRKILDLFCDLFFEVTNFAKEKTAIVFSGGGLHFLVEVDYWDDKTYFKKYSAHYSHICTLLEERLRKENLKFKELDRAVWAPNHMLRLPGTINKKEGRKDRRSFLVQANLVKQEAPWNRIKPPKTSKKASAAVRKAAGKKAAKIDSEKVQEECLFLKNCKQNQASVTEAQWYAALTLWSRLDGGKELCHENSKLHPKYNFDECERKIEQTTTPESGPRTCDNISTLWSGCTECPHFGQIPTPLSIGSKTSAKKISTRDSGFHFIKEDQNGNVTYTPDYEGLQQFFEETHQYKVSEENEAVWVFNGKKYDMFTYTQLRGFAAEHFDPQPMERHVKEFTARVTRHNLVPQTFFEGKNGFINFNNGVLDLASGVLHEHSPEFGFLWVLPYDYNPQAKCPEFDNMMKRITCNDSDLEKLLLETVADAVCDRSYWQQKATILVGEGSNGKSFFLDVVKDLVGKENYSAIGIKDMDSPVKRHMLRGKLVNISDEMPSMKSQDTDTFKKIMGGDITIERKYQDPVTMRCSTKMMFATNELPHTNDNSNGMFRRLILVPFNAVFDHSNKDHSLRDKLKGELAGVFNRVLKSFRELKARGTFHEARASTILFKDYRETNDVIRTFLMENLVSRDLAKVDKEDFIPFNVILEAVRAEALVQGERFITAKKVSATLKRILPDTDARTELRWNEDRTKLQKGYRGIGFLKPDSVVYANGGTHMPKEIAKGGRGEFFLDSEN